MRIGHGACAMLFSYQRESRSGGAVTFAAKARSSRLAPYPAVLHTPAAFVLHQGFTPHTPELVTAFQRRGCAVPYDVSTPPSPRPRYPFFCLLRFAGVASQPLCIDLRRNSACTPASMYTRVPPRTAVHSSCPSSCSRVPVSEYAKKTPHGTSYRGV